MAECRKRHGQRSRRLVLLALMGLAKTSFGPSFVGPRHPKPFSRCKKPASLQRSVSREEMLLSGEGAKVIEALPTVRQEDLPLNTSIALATIAMFGYMSYQFWTRIAFGKAFGTADPVVIQKPEVVFKELQDQSRGKRKRPVGIEGKVSIGMDADTNRGRKVLGLDALIFAYLMFASAFFMLVFGAAAAYYPLLSGQVQMDR
ncbi:hypothetical protein AK812_SmicGene38351 [Symbiodinium microadriaticum]|uniref:Uncharacterized protein n=1 Tax=Symbiodinium microadriaticum TaxID=2951 RepID=A0A1Q9CDX8_SYMMI|nr:hypothetical protein AK812_SmicGene38351 [Symbiodinium microadriaticum]CAE7229738.1 unnamed protein product [Symbiodinium sp. KB8]CAE7457474.1 unnamed protein product [Symbiodinium microadriaticum]